MCLTTLISAATVHGYLKGCEDVTHSIISEPAEAADQNCDRDAFEGIKVDRGTVRDRGGIGFKNDFAGQSPDRGRAWRDKCAPKPRDSRVARHDIDWPASDFGKLAPPDLTAGRKRTHEEPAARRHDDRSPQASGSSGGCSSYAV